MDNALNQYASGAKPAVNRLVRTDPRKPLWQMSHSEKISRAVETGMLPRHAAEQALASKDPAAVYNTEMPGLGTAMLMKSRRWQPPGSRQSAGLFDQPQAEPGSMNARPPASIAGVPANLA